MKNLSVSRRIAAALALPLVAATAILATSPANAASSSYTLKTVAKHSTASNCWTVVNGGVYNVTKWIPKHPGGSQVIAAMCGKDGSAAFNGEHGGSGRVAAELKVFKIGALKK